MATTNQIGQASPYLGINFTMVLPEGVTIQGYKSSPVLTTTPSFDDTTRLVVWSLGAPLAAGKSVTLSLSLMPTTCTTPAALALDGQFSFTDAAGPKTVDACLTKPVRLDSPPSRAIPSPP